MKKTFALVAIIVAVAFITSCATVLGSDQTEIMVNSTPYGADVIVDGYNVGKTPTRIYVDTGKKHMVTIQKEGYPQKQVKLKPHIKWGWQVLDMLTLPLIGNVMDIITDKGWKIRPNDIDVKL